MLMDITVHIHAVAQRCLLSKILKHLQTVYIALVCVVVALKAKMTL